MPTRPNILFLMADQLQAQVFESGHPCRTPNLDQLAERGVRFTRAYTPAATCSPARASLMTGLLPHNHGVLWVTHNVDPDQGVLREDRPHWAQRLKEAGYRTGYFGKWHVEHSNQPGRFGWDTDGSGKGERFFLGHPDDEDAAQWRISRFEEDPPGYQRWLQYGVAPKGPEARSLGEVTSSASQWLDEVLNADEPWCAFVSVVEPHDPFVCGEDAFAHYDVDGLELPPSIHDDLAGRPGLYRKAARTWARMTDRQHREARACYYASITELDTMFGRLLDQVDAAGRLDDTIVVLTSDHGELLGAHGMYCKNVMAAEEIYNIPLTMTGPGVASAEATTARVGLHQLGPTLLDLVDATPLGATDGPSFRPVLADPSRHEDEHTTGYAEYHGGYYLLTQRIYWDDSWKYVYNGFDEDELYDLAADPYELANLIDDPGTAEQADRMMDRIWQVVHETGDRAVDTHYPHLRWARHGPLHGERAAPDMDDPAASGAGLTGRYATSSPHDRDADALSRDQVERS